MRWKSLAGPAIAVGLMSWVACADGSVAGPDGPMLKKGTPVQNPPPATGNGPVWVEGSFSFEVLNGGGGGTAGVNSHPQGKGSCRDESGSINANPALNTVWYNQPQGGHRTNAKFCQGGEGGGGSTVIVCALEPIPATYAFGGAGVAGPGTQETMNENLNFLSDLEPLQPDLHVHYHANSNTTTGRGELTELAFTCTDDTYDGTGSLDLSQFSGSGNMFLYLSPTSRQLDVSGVDIVVGSESYELDDLFWIYRSRVGQ